MQETMHSRTY